MERGVYFDAWHRGQHCYHPSLPSRRLQMVEDLVDLRGTMLVWSALGGGSISLPYLEDEAFGPVALRDRLYGQLNDAEFIAECAKRGIKVFGVVFEAQGWEFPVELGDADGGILSINELRGVGERGWLGLREFNQNAFPGLWKNWEDYFPNGLRNSRGEKVEDIFEECAARALDGSPHRARWVECVDREHICHYMDRNNPVWREYLKAVIRIQIDAGVHGVQLDEASTPLNTLQYGGCFCADCVDGFRNYLAGLPASERPHELDGVDVGAFDYGKFLRERGIEPLKSGAATPLIEYYFAFQRQAITASFGELADYAREYGRSRGRDVLVTGNLFNVTPYYNGIIEHVDLVVTEMRNVAFSQPGWYRFVVGMAGGRQVVVVENPYGGVIAGLLERLDRGEGYDVARLLSFEAAAMGANMTVPYGAWMGNEVEDAFSLPVSLATEIQSFLAQIDPYLSGLSCNDVAVLYDVASNALLSLRRELFFDNRVNSLDQDVPVPFWEACNALADAGIPFDVLPVNDDVVPARKLDSGDLHRYGAVVVPGAVELPAWLRDLLDEYVRSGGRVLVADEDGEAACTARWIAACRTQSRVSIAPDTRVGINTHNLGDGAQAVHLVNYNVEEGTGVVSPIHSLRVRFSTAPAAGDCVTVLRPDAPVTKERLIRRSDGTAEVVVHGLASYAIVALQE